MKRRSANSVTGAARAVLGRAAATLDRAVAEAVRYQTRQASKRSESLSHEQRLAALTAIGSAYTAPHLFERIEAFFPRPLAIAPSLTRVRALREGARGEVFDATWQSLSEPFLPAIRDRYMGHRNNQTAHARLFLSERPRPVAVLIHGYLGGNFSFEERAWPVSWLYRSGFDLALPVLPFHSQRARTDRSGGPPFPGPDPRFTNEGFRQAVHDISALIDFLRARGAPSVGVMGMSLGGYTTSLLATVRENLAFAVPLIPMASVADFARDQGRLGTADQATVQHAALEAANRVVSPFTRPSLVARDRIVVVGADSDRITPIAHAERLAAYFGVDLVRFPGGHLLQVGRGRAFAEVGRRLGWSPAAD